MPRRKKTPLYVARVGFATEIDGEHYVIGAGERIAADHPVVVTLPDHFEALEGSEERGEETATPRSATTPKRGKA